MIEYSMTKTVFFDYDGCIHDSLKIYAPAFRQAQNFLSLAGYGSSDMTFENYSDDFIRKWIGLPPKQMWLEFRPDLPVGIREQASEIIGTHMYDSIVRGDAVLYAGAIETLQKMRSSGYRMILLSHCRLKYIQVHQQAFGLDQYFERIIASESYGYIDKKNILAQIKEQYPYPQVMVGDRASDIYAGKANQMKTIGCNYGFAGGGELDFADYRIDAVSEILEILKI